MKAGYRALLSVFLAALCFFGGCAENRTLLSRYGDTLSLASAGANTDGFDRIRGLSEEVCVILEEDIAEQTNVQAAAGGVFDITHQNTLYCFEPYEQLPMASLTKIMTGLLAVKYGDLDQEVTVSDEVSITTYDAWLCGLQPGDTLTLRDLLKAAMVYSGNDAAAAIAVAVSGSEEAFVKLMNEEAKAIGAESTHFANPHGLDASGHETTVYDLYLIFNQCLQYEELRTIMGMSSVTLNYTNADGEAVSRTLSSGNAYFVKTASPPDGLMVLAGKTGYTENAGRCLILLLNDRNGTEYVSVILRAGDGTAQQLYAHMNLLLETAGIG